MSKIVAFIHLTLDGVMQGPGRPDEDSRDGFEHGGWATPYNDGAIGKTVARAWRTRAPCCSAGERTRISIAFGQVEPTIRSRRCSTTHSSTSRRERSRSHCLG